MIFIRLLIFLCFFTNCYSFIQSLFPEVCCEELQECFSAPLSSITSIFVPRPECPCKDKLIYHLFTRDFETHFQLDQILLDAFQKHRPLYFIVHGWMEAVDDNWVIEMKNTLLKKDDLNVILVDWECMSQRYFYPQAASNTRTIGAHIAKVVDAIRETTKEKVFVWCIGFSLGAHVCGNVGRRTHLNRITGLDPAGPVFESHPEMSLNKDSAVFVDAIHTFIITGFPFPLAHADFYPNGGIIQSHCPVFNWICDHEFAAHLFTSSILHSCHKAQYCPTLKFKESCQACLDCHPVGYNANLANQGIFYFITGKKYPYCID